MMSTEWGNLSNRITFTRSFINKRAGPEWLQYYIDFLRKRRDAIKALVVVSADSIIFFYLLSLALLYIDIYYNLLHNNEP